MKIPLLIVEGSPACTPGTPLIDDSVSRVELFRRIQRYALARQRALVQLKYIQTLDESDYWGDRLDMLTASLRDCANYLVFHHYPTLNDSRLVKGSFCRIHHLCPLCAIRRAAKLLQRYLARYELILASKPNLVPYMFTFTVKDGPDLAERTDHLYDSMRRYLTYRRLGITSKTRHSLCELNKIEAAAYAYEVTRDDDWHCHIHMLALCDPNNLPDFPYGSRDGYLKKNCLLSQEWLKMTGDSFIVDGRPIVGNVMKGFLEVFKYIVKFSDLKPAQVWEAYTILRGRRLLNSFGEFRKVKESDLDGLDEAIKDEDLPYIEFFCRYVDGYYEITEYQG